MDLCILLCLKYNKTSGMKCARTLIVRIVLRACWRTLRGIFFFINNDPNHLIQFLVIFKKFHPFQKAYFSRFKFHVLSHKFKIQRILLAEVHLLNNNIWEVWDRQIWLRRNRGWATEIQCKVPQDCNQNQLHHMLAIPCESIWRLCKASFNFYLSIYCKKKKVN